MRKFFMASVLLLAALSASAQQEVGTWALTPRVGLASAGMSNQKIFTDVGGADYKDAERKIGFVGGADVTWRLHQQVGFSAGLFYSNEGFKYPEIEGLKLKHSLSFLNMPLMGNFYVTDHLCINAGVQVSWLAAASQTLRHGDQTETRDLNNYKSLNFAVPVGVSYQQGNVVLDLRYNIGLRDLNDHELTGETCRTNSLWLTLGYRIPFAL